MFCELFGYSKQAYYKANSRCLKVDTQRAQLMEQVLSIRRSMPRIGGRKLHYLLKQNHSDHKSVIGRDRLFTFLAQHGLLVSRRKKYCITTQSRHWMKKYPNIIKDLVIERPEQVWVSDITYLEMSKGNLYLHLVTDAYSKQIMGYELARDMESSSTAKALQMMALAKRNYSGRSLIHHSDRGSQYCSLLYKAILQQEQVAISMTENGDPYENAVAERVNGILKDEFGLADTFYDMKQALKQVHQSVDIYNNLRPHMSCHMLTPAQMHRQDALRIKTWKNRESKLLTNFNNTN